MASFDWSKFTEKDYNELLELIGSGNREKLNAEKDKWTVTSGKFSFVFDIYCDEKDGKYYLDAEVYEEELVLHRLQSILGGIFLGRGEKLLELAWMHGVVSACGSPTAFLEVLGVIHPCLFLVFL